MRCGKIVQVPRNGLMRMLSGIHWVASEFFMHLANPDNEAAYRWLCHNTEGEKDKCENLTWRIGTGKLYTLYQNWVRRTDFNEIPIEDMWTIIQIHYPFTEIMGPRGQRVYIGIRQKYNSGNEKL